MEYFWGTRYENELSINMYPSLFISINRLQQKNVGAFIIIMMNTELFENDLICQSSKYKRTGVFHFNLVLIFCLVF